MQNLGGHDYGKIHNRRAHGAEIRACRDYYLIAGDDEPEHEPIGIWGQRHGKYLREHKHAVYSVLLISGKLDGYLRDIDRQAEVMLNLLETQMAEREEITEQFKSKHQMEWVREMNNIRVKAEDIVYSELIYC